MIQQSINEELKCQEHNEQAIFIDFSIKDSRLQNKCLKCVGRERQLWVDVQEADRHLENVKQTVLNEKQFLHQKNLEVLQELSSQLKQLKITFNNNLDKTLLNIDQQIEFIQKAIDKENKSIIGLKISQLDSFESQNNSVQLQQIDYQQLQSFYGEQIKRLRMDQQFIQFEENLKKIEYNQKDSIQEVIQTFSSGIFQSSRILNQNWHCDNHQLQVALVDLNEQGVVPNRLACIDCVTEYPIKYTKLEQLKQFWLDYVDKTLNYQEQQQINLNEKASKAMQRFSVYQEVISNLVQQLTQTILLRNTPNCQVTQNLIKLKTKNWYQLDKSEIIEISNLMSITKKQEIINDSIRNEFKGLQIQLKTNFLDSFKTFQENLIAAFQQIYEEIQIELNTVETEQYSNNSPVTESGNLQLQNQNTMKQPFKYEIINTIKDQRIETFAFNENHSLLAVGYYDSNKIKIHEFNQGQMIEIQELTDHKQCIFCLNFFKQSQQLLSGSFDNTIIIWEMDSNNKWNFKFSLNGHGGGIYCLSLNNNENQIISGSADKSIKIWDKDQEWKCIQTLSVHKNQITSISLSQSNQYLVSCSSKDEQIFIFKFQVDQKLWIQFQAIKMDNWGFKVCFLENLTFAFQPFNNTKMYIFQINNSNNQFIKECEVEVKAGNSCYHLFPLQFIQSKLMIINRNGGTINFIRKQENGSYITQFFIDYEADRIFGTMSEDGQYLITWDKQSQEIQIRQYRE
ncbi:unnamed protein product [Paramecium pentaurelia]|uniref:WD domain, G-beta repeat protein n=1 Tax=Paramecium pentaurelia TaxID=43138 RepID=A0A8S1VS44_9CILI|nr:unnamed protein product [Paramecium pentaurelia]